MDIHMEIFVEPDTYADGHMVRLQQKGTCPYLTVQLLGQDFAALLDSGSGLSLMSRKSANRLMSSQGWQSHLEKGEVNYKTDLRVTAINCNGDPLQIVGRLLLPAIAIGGIDLQTTCSFWVMEGSVDKILLSNDWLRPLQGAIAWKNGNQYLYFHRPTGPLTAGGEESAPKYRPRPSRRWLRTT